MTGSEIIDYLRGLSDQDYEQKWKNIGQDDLAGAATRLEREERQIYDFLNCVDGLLSWGEDWVI